MFHSSLSHPPHLGVIFLINQIPQAPVPFLATLWPSPPFQWPDSDQFVIIWGAPHQPFLGKHSPGEPAGCRCQALEVAQALPGSHSSCVGTEGQAGCHTHPAHTQLPPLFCSQPQGSPLERNIDTMQEFPLAVREHQLCTAAPGDIKKRAKTSRGEKDKEEITLPVLSSAALLCMQGICNYNLCSAVPFSLGVDLCSWAQGLLTHSIHNSAFSTWFTFPMAPSRMCFKCNNQEFCMHNEIQMCSQIMRVQQEGMNETLAVRKENKNPGTNGRGKNKKLKLS